MLMKCSIKCNKEIEKTEFSDFSVAKNEQLASVDIPPETASTLNAETVHTHNSDEWTESQSIRIVDILPQDSPQIVKGRCYYEGNASSLLNSPASKVREKKYLCDICHRDFSTKSNLNRHRKKCNTTLRFYCEICGDVFFRSYDLIIHQRTHSKHTLQPQCNDDVGSMRSNGDLVSNENPVIPDVNSISKDESSCGATGDTFHENIEKARFGRSSEFNTDEYTRMKEGHTDSDVLVSPDMKPLLSAGSIRVIYDKSWSNETTDCESDGANNDSNNNENDIGSLSEKHDTKEMYAMLRLNRKSECSNASYVISSFQKPPVISTSTELDRLRCYKCFKHFSTKSNLNRHVKMCKGPAVPTITSTMKSCKRRSSNNIVHSNADTKLYPTSLFDIEPVERPRLQCSKCTNVFSTKSNLNRHVKACQGHKTLNYVVDAEKPVIPVKQATQKPRTKVVYQCKVCSKICLTSYALLEHERVHTGDRPFRCVHCGKSFTTKSNWRRHLIHSCMKKRDPGNMPPGMKMLQHLEPSDDEELITQLGSDAPCYNPEPLRPAVAVSPYNRKLIYDNEEIVIVKTNADIEHVCSSPLIHNDNDDGMEFSRGDVDLLEPVSDMKDNIYRKIEALFPNEEHEMTSEGNLFYNSNSTMNDVGEKMQDMNDGEEIIVVKPEGDNGFDNFYLSRHNEPDMVSGNEVGRRNERDMVSGNEGGDIENTFGRLGGEETENPDSLLSKCINRISQRKKLSMDDPKKIDLFECCVNESEPKLYNGDEEIVIVHAEPEICELYVPQEKAVTGLVEESHVVNNELEKKESAVR